jgi:hypothetical protein
MAFTWKQSLHCAHVAFPPSENSEMLLFNMDMAELHVQVALPVAVEMPAHMFESPLW